MARQTIDRAYEDGYITALQETLRICGRAETKTAAMEIISQQIAICYKRLHEIEKAKKAKKAKKEEKREET